MFDEVRHRDPNIARDDAEMKKFDKLARSRTLPGACIVYKVYTDTALAAGTWIALDTGEDLRVLMEAELGKCTPRVPGVTGVVMWSGGKKIKLKFNDVSEDELILDSDLIGRVFSLAIGDLQMDKIWIASDSGVDVDFTLFVTT